jgi:hypothetical protein
MSALPTNQEVLLLAQVLKKQELDQKNKLAAREQLLRIQLMLAKRVSS